MDATQPDTQSNQPVSQESPTINTEQTAVNKVTGLRQYTKWFVVALLILFFGILIGFGLNKIISNKNNTEPLTATPTLLPSPTPSPFLEPTLTLSPRPSDATSSAGAFCSGVVPCDDGYQCQLDDPNTPSGGKCVKSKYSY